MGFQYSHSFVDQYIMMLGSPFDPNIIISGTGKAFCDGVEELLMPGVMHICPQCSEHSIINTGEEDLVMLTIVVKK